MPIGKSGLDSQYKERERNVLFNDTLNTFYLRLYGVRHMVKDHSDSEKGNPLRPHRLLLSISSKGSFICTIPRLLLHQSWSTQYKENKDWQNCLARHTDTIPINTDIYSCTVLECTGQFCLCFHACWRFQSLSQTQATVILLPFLFNQNRIKSINYETEEVVGQSAPSTISCYLQCVWACHFLVGWMNEWMNEWMNV